MVTASADRRVGPDETVPPGEKGEIIACLDSDEAFAGYWNRPDADARALRDGWYFTGDMGYLDAEGELYVSGRVDDMIITGGENVHPVEVEEALARHPLVRDVAVVGEPDERWGERVVAFVVRGIPRPDRGDARPALPRVPGSRELQAPAADRLRERDPEDGLGQDPSPTPAGGARHGGSRMSEFLRVERRTPSPRCGSTASPR